MPCSWASAPDDFDNDIVWITAFEQADTLAQDGARDVGVEAFSAPHKPLRRFALHLSESPAWSDA